MWSLVARTPMSAPASRLSLPIRKTRPQMRCAIAPSVRPTWMMRSLISRRSTPVFTISGASASKSSSAGHDRTQRTFGDLRDRVVNDAQLRAQLTVRAGRVDLAEAVLPEATPNRQQRIVIDDDRAILDRSRRCACPEVAARLHRRACREARAHPRPRWASFAAGPCG